MQIDNTIIQTTSSLITPVAMLFLQDTILTMVPWLAVMFSCIICDLAAGIRKSFLLGINVSWSMAFRETMGKMVVYFAFVMMVASIEVATSHDIKAALYGCLIISVIEFGSVISNIFKPYGIEISLLSILKIFFKRFLHFSTEEVEALQKQEKIKKIVFHEKERWEGRKKLKNK